MALLLPLAGAMASFWHNTSLLLLLFLIAAIVPSVTIISLGLKADRGFMTAIACISLFLLLSATMASGDLLGWDIHQEYSIFLQVLQECVWRPRVDIPYNSVLSISILPVILSEVSGLDGLGVFKIIYPLLFSMVPVVLYKAYRKALPPVAAFLSVLLFMSYSTFSVELIALARQEVAELLLVLTLWILLWRKTSRSAGTVVTILLLTLGIITAHYSLAYLYLFLLVFSFFLSRIFGKNSRLVDSTLLVITVSTTVVWYALLASGTDFSDFLYFFWSVGRNLQEFLNPFSRPGIVLAAVGVGAYSGLLHVVNRAVYYAVHFVLICGFLVFAYKKGKNEEESKMLSIVAAGMALLALLVILPYFAEVLDFSRTYHISLLLAAPCFGYGAAWLPRFGRKVLQVILRRQLPHIVVPSRTTWSLASTLLILFFLFSSGWVWAVSMDRPTSFILDSDRMLTYPDPSYRIAYFGYFTAPQDIAGAEWLRAHPADGRPVCADFTSSNNVLASHGGIPRPYHYAGPFPYGCDLNRADVYVSLVNTEYALWTTPYLTNDTLPMSMIYPLLATRNRVYSNGGTEIYG